MIVRVLAEATSLTCFYPALISSVWFFFFFLDFGSLSVGFFLRLIRRHFFRLRAWLRRDDEDDDSLLPS